MPRVLLASRDPGSLSGLAIGWSEKEAMSVRWAASPGQALAEARRWHPNLVVVDEGLGEPGPWALIRELMAVDAAINTAVASNLSEDEFHQASEGLGVMTQLPSRPGPAEVAWLMHHLQGLAGAGS